METSLAVRRHRTAAERSEILAAFGPSGLTREQFAAQRGIASSTLHRWLRRARHPTEPTNPARDTPPTFVAVPHLLTPAAPPATEPGYQIHFPNGMKVEVGTGFGLAELTGLLHAVRAL